MQWLNQNLRAYIILDFLWKQACHDISTKWKYHFFCLSLVLSFFFFCECSLVLSIGTNKKGKHFTITLYSYFPFTKKSTSPLFIDKRNISIRNAQHNNPFQPFFFSFLCLCILLNGVVLFILELQAKQSDGWSTRWCGGTQLQGKRSQPAYTPVAREIILPWKCGGAFLARDVAGSNIAAAAFFFWWITENKYLQTFYKTTMMRPWLPLVYF
jgi:hypothetical protein